MASPAAVDRLFFPVAVDLWAQVSEARPGRAQSPDPEAQNSDSPPHIWRTRGAQSSPGKLGARLPTRSRRPYIHASPFEVPKAMAVYPLDG